MSYSKQCCGVPCYAAWCCVVLCLELVGARGRDSGADFEGSVLGYYYYSSIGEVGFGGVLDVARSASEAAA